MESNRDRLKHPVTEADWTRGPAKAPVTLLEYVDFQCPCCQGSYPVVESLLEEWGDRVRYVVREFPLGSLHPYAEGAARAAEAAGRQGKFWEMYHALFRARGRLTGDDLELLARELGLDLARFRRDMSGEAVQQKLTDDKRGGLRNGVNGTPTLLLDGVRYEEAVCPVVEEELRAAVEAMLAAQA